MVTEALDSVMNDFSYPVAFPYSLVFDEKQAGSVRRWATGSAMLRKG